MKKNNAFTLLEIVVVITLIGLIALSASKINFNNLSDRQRVDGFFYKIKNEIETIQNNALIGKAVDGLYVPKIWKIAFSNTGSGKIISYYLSGSYIKYDEIIPKDFYGIKIYNDGNKIDLTDTGSIILEGTNMTLSGITSNDKKLKIEINYKSFIKTIEINTVSGVIEEQ